MNKNESNDAVKDTLDSVNSITTLITKLAALITGLSALAIISGWKKATTYYQELGAPWVTNMLSPSALFQYSAQQFLGIGIIVFLIIILIAEKSITEKSLRIYCGVFMVLAFIILSIEIIPSNWLNLSSLSMYTWIVTAAFLMSISSAFCIGILITNLSYKKLKWNDFHLSLLFAILWLGLWQSAEYSARAKANYEGNLKSSDLPLVSLVIPIAGKEWRLVTNLDSSFLVVSLAETKGDRVFRILSASDISSIKSTRSK